MIFLSLDQFAVQTCFMGKFGEEIGSDQFGATIMASGSELSSNDTQVVILRISNIEVNKNIFYVIIKNIFSDNLCRSSISSRSISSTFSYEW